MKVITRFAPSPTGLLHAGSYRSALFAYIFAKKNNGKFILRIEDTDKIRSKKEFEDNIVSSLEWLGLKYDEFYRQSERTEIYKKYIKKLIDSDKAYISKETPKQEGDRDEVIRFRNPNKKVAFQDIIRGKIEFDTTELGDFVIAKSLEEPVFHLVNVVDDIEMNMTHIIRGEDHISNTPRQILIYEALGAPIPLFAHIPLLLSKDRSKLSKRHGALPISMYKEKGFIPASIVNYMSLLGWHPEDDKEIMDLDEIVQKFTLERVQKSGAIFDEEKMLWFNRQYITKMDIENFTRSAGPFMVNIDPAISMKCMPILKEKISSFDEIRTVFANGGELAFILNENKYDSSMLLWKKNPSRENAKKHLESVMSKLASIEEGNFTSENIKKAIWDYVEANGKGDVLWPLRVAITGQEKSPDPVISAYLLGKQQTQKRLEVAIKLLS